MELIVDPPLDGPTNMAVDECLLGAAAPGGAAVLRLYRWSPATLSLGYFQSYRQFEELSSRAGLLRDLAPLPVVRRCTGGGAILHADELTYSLILPGDHALAQGSAESLYVWMHARIAEAVAQLGGAAHLKGEGACTARGGPFLCFECLARFDLLAGGRGSAGEKLVGSAQRRKREGVLQHGSVVLRKIHPAQPGASLHDMLGRTVAFEELAGAIAAAVRSAGIPLTDPKPAAVPPEELAAHRAVYAGEDWTRRR